MLHTLHYPAPIIAERVHFTPADQALLARCRGAHNRLGLAYQLGFLRLTGRFPQQEPLERLEGVLTFVAHILGADPSLLPDYTERRQTISEHQQLLQQHLGVRPCGPAEREALGHFLLEEATRLAHTPALLSQAETFLRDQQILLPADSTLRRLVGEHRERARQQIAARLLAGMPSEMPAQLDALLAVEAERTVSPLHDLKEPPGIPSARALLRVTAKLDQIQATGVLALDLNWLNPNFQNVLTRQAQQASATRLRDLPAPQRYTVLVCFLMQTYRETLDHLVLMYDKLMATIHRRAQRDLDEAVKRLRPTLRSALRSFQVLGQTLCDSTIAPEAVRATIFAQLPEERLHKQLQAAQDWLSGATSDVFPLVMKRYSYLRQFAPSLLAHLPVALETTGIPALLEAITLLRDLNTSGQRTLPEDAPLTAFPTRLRAFVEGSTPPDRRTYECALLTTLRTELKRGNVWVPGSKRFGRLDDFFMPMAQWEPRRQAFFQHAGLPADPTAAGTWLRTRFQEAYSHFVTTFPTNTAVTIDAKGWRLGADPADEVTAEDEAGVTALHRWLRDKSPTIRLPDLLIAVDNDLHWTRHFLPPTRRLLARPTKSARSLRLSWPTAVIWGPPLWPSSPQASARMSSSASPIGRCRRRHCAQRLLISSTPCWHSILGLTGG